jgi:hypothetical protein
MSEVFADTFFFLALANPNDPAHESADAAFDEYGRRLVTTQWVLVEVGNSLSRRTYRRKFTALLGLLGDNPDAVIVPATPQLYERGVALHKSRHDKEWSVTDCISFLIMKERGIRDALTGDRHFDQAGFRALLKD